MFPRDNEAAWINRPGNGMHLRGKSRDREREREREFKTFNSKKGYRGIFEKKSVWRSMMDVFEELGSSV